MSGVPRTAGVKNHKPRERRLRVVLSPHDERRWWEKQLGVRLLDRLYTGDRAGR